MKPLGEVRKQGKRFIGQMIDVGRELLGKDFDFITIFETIATRAYVAGYRDGEGSKK